MLNYPAWHWLSIARFIIGLMILGVSWSVLHRLRIMHRDVRILRRQAKLSATEAMDEARAAHRRLDDIDIDKKAEREDKIKLFEMLKTIKGRVTNLQHKDVRDKIEEQEALDRRREKE